MDKFEKAAKANKGTYICVLFTLKDNWEEMSDIVEKVTKECSGSVFGSGAGFGERDMSIGFTDEKHATKFTKSIQKHFKSHRTRIKIKSTPLSEYFN